MWLSRDWPAAGELVEFRDRMRGRQQRSAAFLEREPDDINRETLADVTSLVEALDELLG
jgi:hypothetical protein